MEDLTCMYCGNPCPNDAILSANPTKGAEPAWLVMCQRCFSFTKTCALCVEGRSCLFETSDSPLPKQVQQTIRQGNAVIQTIVKNPERIRETCQKSCKCWSDDFGCLKQNGTCGQYKEGIFNVKV